jgi:hypothetical protein
MAIFGHGRVSTSWRERPGTYQARATSAATVYQVAAQRTSTSCADK